MSYEQVPQKLHEIAVRVGECIDENTADAPRGEKLLEVCDCVKELCEMHLEIIPKDESIEQNVRQARVEHYQYVLELIAKLQEEVKDYEENGVEDDPDEIQDDMEDFVGDVVDILALMQALPEVAPSDDDVEIKL